MEDNEHSLSGSARSYSREVEELKLPPEINVQNLDINSQDLADSDVSESMEASNEQIPLKPGP